MSKLDNFLSFCIVGGVWLLVGVGGVFLLGGLVLLDWLVWVLFFWEVSGGGNDGVFLAGYGKVV